MVYQTREWVTNLVVKRFDALIKNLCNAAATLAAFVFMVWVQHSVSGNARPTPRVARDHTACQQGLLSMAVCLAYIVLPFG